MPRRSSTSSAVGCLILAAVGGSVLLLRLVIDVLSSISAGTYLGVSVIAVAGTLGWLHLAQRHEQQRLASEEAEIGRLRAEDLAEAERLLAENTDLTTTFLEISERKISVLDEYGDESWDRLPKLIEDCIAKIGARTGASPDEVRSIRKTLKQRGPLGYETDRERRLLLLADLLESRFRAHHEERRSGSARLIDHNALTGEEFEAHVARVLARAGYTSVRGTPTVGDQGADLLAEKAGRLLVIQVKRYAGSVGNGAVQEVVAALKYYGGDEAWVITNSTFTKSAVSLAQANDVRLVDGQELRRIEAQAA